MNRLTINWFLRFITNSDYHLINDLRNDQNKHYYALVVVDTYHNGNKFPH